MGEGIPGADEEEVGGRLAAAAVSEWSDAQAVDRLLLR